MGMRKTHELNEIRSEFMAAKQKYTQITNWLKLQSNDHRNRMLNEIYNQYANHPQYAQQYTPQQLQQYAQQQMAQKWQAEYSSLKQQLNTAQNQMQTASNYSKQINQQLVDLQNKKENVLRNTPSG